ncbi:RING-H2 finger protein ATL2-like [Telopea speciosissima]|uniref:RING-H2 finger protein ATL2-like n=1 Tax=Telopea speciosissima TaxID=54955 RepID=UPI001CC5188E|nr:RING-H2 finger protein ATL2-like [Telopea speciosissima]
MASDNSGYYFGDDVWYHSAGKVTALCVLIVIVIFIYFYAWRTYRRHARETAQSSINGVSSSSQVVHSRQLPINKALHQSLIDSLPTFLYSPTHHFSNSTSTTTSECPVCLCNLEEGEMVRLIPTCKHMFHLQCINMWLSSHYTCPICRSPVQVSSTGGHQEMSIWVPSQLDSFNPATTTTSSESTSDDASSQTSSSISSVPLCHS